MALCNKTPVAILHELCIRRNLSEQFSLVSTSGMANDPMFEMCVETTNGLKATGIGKTKKEAKHNAAKAMLLKMNAPALSYGEKVKPAPPVINPHSERNANGNAIGRLQEYCSQNGLPTPVYELTGDEGEPHEKTFSMKCEVSQRYETGVGRTKQQAKHNAAQAMCDNLMQNPLLSQREFAVTAEPSPRVKALSEEQLNQLGHLYQSQKIVTSLPLTSPGLKFSVYHESMKNSLTSIKDELEPKTFVNAGKTLRDFVDKLSLTLNFHPGFDVDAKCKRFFMYAVVNTQPTTVRLGEGDSEVAATEKASLNVLKYWQTFVCAQ